MPDIAPVIVLRDDREFLIYLMLIVRIEDEGVIVQTAVLQRCN